MFGLHDKVRIKDGGPGVWTIEQIMDVESPKKYWIELNGEFTTRQWKTENELELVEKAKS